MVVSANTLYQNISIIRRGLRTVGENEDTLIITVPRRGFQIEPDNSGGYHLYKVFSNNLATIFDVFYPREHRVSKRVRASACL
ncbi:hypothetical protein MJN51_41640, partial [Salmonella enterica subsp. enterica serovar Kentucky]|nr:hypothetical protein [Salmonella enterica subsp. enterica serovar Kentucky]